MSSDSLVAEEDLEDSQQQQQQQQAARRFELEGKKSLLDRTSHQLKDHLRQGAAKMRRKISTSSSGSASSVPGVSLCACAAPGEPPSEGRSPACVLQSAQQQQSGARRLLKRHRTMSTVSQPSLLQQMLSIQPLESMLKS